MPLPPRDEVFAHWDAHPDLTAQQVVDHFAPTDLTAATLRVWKSRRANPPAPRPPPEPVPEVITPDVVLKWKLDNRADCAATAKHFGMEEEAVRMLVRQRKQDVRAALYVLPALAPPSLPDVGDDPPPAPASDPARDSVTPVTRSGLVRLAIDERLKLLSQLHSVGIPFQAAITKAVRDLVEVHPQLVEMEKADTAGEGMAKEVDVFTEEGRSALAAELAKLPADVLERARAMQG